MCRAFSGNPWERLLTIGIQNQRAQHVVVRLLEERRVISHVWNAQRSRLIGGVENSVPAAEHRLAEQVVGNADSRPKIVLLVRHQAGRRIARHGDFRKEVWRQRILPVPRDLQCIGGDVEVRLGAVCLFSMFYEVIT